MYYVPLDVQCIYGCSGEEHEDGDGKEGSEIPGGWERVEITWLLYMQMTWFSVSEEDLRAMVGRFAEVCRR